MPIDTEDFEVAETKCADPLDLLKQEVRKSILKFAESTNREFMVELTPEYFLIGTMSSPTSGYVFVDVAVKITKEI